MNTKKRILIAAERLFAEQGFAQTSMREITTEADVNLAAINYHFGSKNNLIQAVFQRYFDQLMPDLNKVLNAVNERDDVNVEDVFGALIAPLMALEKIRSNGAAVFLLLLGRGYNESRGHMRKFIQAEYGETLSMLVQCIHKSVSWISAETLFWRLHFALGSVVFSMAARTALSEIVEADFNHQTSTHEILLSLLPFVSQGISAK
ncbi:TetR/AcrR family transcriptional regulator [Alteromonas sediminis]|uniref:TetR/AcrR family transcriptional regulator n=1 Tax=Alteromonas sediminis TaxID=2259342 RepID=A0A3N5Y8R9_9ALTE|nr:TetR/AcrR family transcriptional regulator [Alteromonas sediminis]RPJ67559.1 TetR/AcrR family transcriptional regulator [Alteromonas sediminis]